MKTLILVFAICLLMIIFAIAFQVRGEDAQYGTASWYSVESCKREGTSGIWTASGEKFNENDMTGAMWNVDFGTRVIVKNTLTNKQVCIIINDRGPSKKLVKQGRIIDLSKSAFKKIGNLRDGIIPVEVRILNEIRTEKTR